ncbi:MAG TPA: peptidase M28 [Candidatus Hydrogenedentes bacterium]|nr:peptidase M28 [Candidatus Hydrogenedentota bacterium]
MWEQIRSNKRRSVFLVFLIAVLLFILGYVIGEAAAPGAGIVGLAVALVVWVIMSLVAYFQGGKILLAVSGAREIAKEDHPQLFNVVEEMTIAAALPKMPRIFIIDDMAMNAFATGRSPDDAAVAVTAGLLGRLNRDELQGVVAHEMSHVVNRDVLLMSMVGVMLGAIVMVSEVFLRGLWYSGGRSRRYRSSSRGGGQGQAVMVVVAIVLAILAPILAQLIYFAISRRREYLADANAAILTRYPEGLASALEKIGGDSHRLVKANKATAPMYIHTPFKQGRSAAGLTSTHPPIAERVRILRSITGNVSYRHYQQAWAQTGAKDASRMPASALAADKALPIRNGEAPADKKDARQRMREAGDVLRKVNQFVFLPCVCGLRLKLPPGFKHDHVRCPKCKRTLAVPAAQLAAAAAVGETMRQQAGATGGIPLAKARAAQDESPLEITQRGRGWMTFKCSCGATRTLAPNFEGDRLRCTQCGREIRVRRP